MRTLTTCCGCINLRECEPCHRRCGSFEIHALFISSFSPSLTLLPLSPRFNFNFQFFSFCGWKFHKIDFHFRTCEFDLMNCSAQMHINIVIRRQIRGREWMLFGDSHVCCLHIRSKSILVSHRPKNNSWHKTVNGSSPYLYNASAQNSAHSSLTAASNMCAPLMN